MTVFLPRPSVRVCIVSVQKLLGDGSSHHYKDLSEEMVAPVYQGSGVKLLGDGSSHHYKDPFEKGKEAIDGCACISRIWG